MLVRKGAAVIGNRQHAPLRCAQARPRAISSVCASKYRSAMQLRRTVIARDSASPSGASGNSSHDAKPGTYTIRTKPTDRVLNIWRKAECVCFDVDCTITVNDSLDLLADFMGCKAAVEALTSQAMDGSLTLQAALEQRLEIINCKPADIKRFIATHPPQSRMVKEVAELIHVLQARGIAVYLISGGFRELTLPIAAYLGVPKDRVFANRINWQWDDDTGEPTKLVGFDISEPTSRNQGKVEAIAQIRKRNPYNNIVMIGDGITDLEAVQISGGADLFIGFGGIVERAAVAAAAEWYIYEYKTLLDSMLKLKVACVGSGAWACAALRLVAQNTLPANDPADEFVDDVSMWVYEEDCNGRKLTEVINETHENPLYLPGVDLGSNVVAVPDIETAVKDADCIILCAPHQFVHRICKQLQGKVKPGAYFISLTKGMRVKAEGPQLISAMIQRYLEVDCSVLMGANIATDIAAEQLSEAVIGYNNLANATIWKRLFARPFFMVELVPDVVGAEMCGTLKNIVALAAGMVDGLGLGPNSKAAIMRQGLEEMRKLSKALYPSVRDDTFLMTCGIGDLIATCYGGRNRLVAEAWTRSQLANKPKTFEELETELLKGQKLQGVLTSNEVQEILKSRDWEVQYPLFTTVHRIISNRLPPDYVVKYVEGAKLDIASLSSVTSDTDDLGLPVRGGKAPPAPKAVAAAS